MGLGDSQVALDILLNAVDNTKGGVEGATGRLGKLGDLIGFVGKTATATAGAAVAFGGVAVKVFEDAGSAAHEMSTKFGMSAQQASSWLAAGRSLNISNDTLMTGFQQLTRTMNNLDLQFLTTGKLSKTQTEVFRDLKVSILDAHGKMRPLNDVMLDIAARFAAMPDGAAKAGLAMKLFGRSGTDMIPFLDQGAKTIKDFMSVANQYGAVVGEDDVEATRAFHLQLAELKLRGEGVLITFARGLMPALGTVFGVINGMVMPSLLTFSQWFAKEGAPRVQDFALKVAQVGERELPKLWDGAKRALTMLQPMIDPIKQIVVQLVGLVPAVASASSLMGVWGSATSALPSLLNLIVVALKLAAPLIKAVGDNANVLAPAVYAVGVAFMVWKGLAIAQLVLGIAGAFTAMAAQEGILAAATALLGISFGPLTLILLAVAAVVGLVALAWKNNWGDIQGKTRVAVAFISDVVGGMVGFFRVAIPAVLTTVVGLWNGITTVFGNIVGFIKTWGPLIFVLLTGPIGLAVLFVIQNFGQIKDTIGGAIGWVVNMAKTVWGGLTGILSGPIAVAKTLLAGFWNDIKNQAQAAWGLLTGIAGVIFGQVRDAILSPFKNLKIPLPHFSFGSHQENIAGVKLTVPDVDVKWYGAGGNFVAMAPTLIGVGDRGPEAVSIRPLGAQGAPAGNVAAATASMDETNRLLREIGKVLMTQQVILQRILDDPGSINPTTAVRRFAV